VTADFGTSPRRLFLRERLRRGQTDIGTFVHSADPIAVEALAPLGFDLFCVDAEHGHVSIEALQSLVRAADLHGVDMLVRVRECSAAEVGSSLDAGAAGVLIPRISGVAEATLAARLARFPPEGARGFGPGRAARYGLEMESYLELARRTTLVAVQIETDAGLAELDEILELEGVDVVFIGPNDLALSLGLRHPGAATVLDQTIASIVARVGARRRIAGIFVSCSDEAVRWLAEGVQLVLFGSDAGFMVRGAHCALRSLRAKRA
jgi:4-hydroxy-2-oxoheptanedioate aldolase